MHMMVCFSHTAIVPSCW